jgi:hypothetical protein
MEKITIEEALVKKFTSLHFNGKKKKAGHDSKPLSSQLQQQTK